MGCKQAGGAGLLLQRGLDSQGRSLSAPRCICCMQRRGVEGEPAALLAEQQRRSHLTPCWPAAAQITAARPPLTGVAWVLGVLVDGQLPLVGGVELDLKQLGVPAQRSSQRGAPDVRCGTRLLMTGLGSAEGRALLSPQPAARRLHTLRQTSSHQPGRWTNGKQGGDACHSRRSMRACSRHTTAACAGGAPPTWRGTP